MQDPVSWQERLQGLGLGGALAVDEQARQALLRDIRAEPDPLHRAGGIYAFHQHRLDASRSVLADLAHARAVFAANGRDHEALRCVFALVNTLRVLGAARSACALIRQCLDSFNLTQDERCSLAYQGVHALTQLLRYDEAEAMACRYLVPVLSGEGRKAAHFIWWLSLGYLRLQQYARAAVHCNVCALDLDPARPADLPLAARWLADARRCLEGARAAARTPIEGQTLRIFDLVVQGCEGRIDVVEAQFDALACELADAPAPLRLGLLVNTGVLLQHAGRLERAYHLLKQAEALGRSSDAHGPLHMASYALARLAQALGKTDEALGHYETFVRLDAEARRTAEGWFDELADLHLPADPQQGMSSMHPEQLRAARPPFLRRALAALDQRLANPPAIGALAAELGVSARALEKAMTRYVGQSPLAYLREQRMRRALEQLRATRRPVSEIASELGYTHASSFARDFRKTYGLSPGAARRDAPDGQASVALQ